MVDGWWEEGLRSVNNLEMKHHAYQTSLILDQHTFSASGQGHLS